MTHREGEEAELLKQKTEDRKRCRRVENALFRRACGYVQELRKPIKVKRIEYDVDTGKKISEREELETGIEEKYIPPDLRVCAYFLNNRDPARWRDHPGEGGEDVDGMVELPPVSPPTCRPSGEEVCES